MHNKTPFTLYQWWLLLLKKTMCGVFPLCSKGFISTKKGLRRQCWIVQDKDSQIRAREKYSFHKHLQRSGSKSIQKPCIQGRAFSFHAVIIETKALFWRPYGKLGLSFLSKRDRTHSPFEDILHPPARSLILSITGRELQLKGTCFVISFLQWKYCCLGLVVWFCLYGIMTWNSGFSVEKVIDPISSTAGGLTSLSGCA